MDQKGTRLKAEELIMKLLQSPRQLGLWIVEMGMKCIDLRHI